MRHSVAGMFTKQGTVLCHVVTTCLCCCESSLDSSLQISGRCCEATHLGFVVGHVPDNAMCVDGTGFKRVLLTAQHVLQQRELRPLCSLRLRRLASGMLLDCIASLSAGCGEQKAQTPA